MEGQHLESLYPETALYDEIEQLLGFVRGGNSCQLLGLPGAGRSNLLGFLSYNKQIRDKHLGDTSKRLHFVLVDFSEMRGRPLVDVMKFLFLNLTESLRERKMSEENNAVGAIFREHLQFGDELILFQGFKEAVDYLCLDRDITVVFLLDRFEEYIPTVTAQFFTNLRILRNRAKYKFSVVFSLYRPLESLVDSMLLSDYYDFVAGNWVHIRFYDEAGTNFFISYLEKLSGKKLDKGAHKEILKLTGGHAKITRLAIEACLAHDKKEGGLEEFLLSQASIKAALSEMWLSLTPVEQSDILHNSFEDAAVVKYLEDSGLVKDKKILMPIFATYIKTPDNLLKLKEEKIVYDENTNSIRKGNAILSDRLTSSEFRLLRYLLQNQERVVERDEIINIVWEGVKSTAGITDQAVDQLIFRLRRKIEEDPNSPKYLQTVKGRGFKFTS